MLFISILSSYIIVIATNVFSQDKTVYNKSRLSYSFGLSLNKYNSFAEDFSIKNNIGFHISLHKQYFLLKENDGGLCIGLEPSFHYSMSSFEDLSDNDYYSINKNAKTKYTQAIIMLTFGANYHKTDGIDFSIGLGQAWYSIDKCVYDLQEQLFDQFTNKEYYYDYLNQAQMLHDLNNETVYAWRIRFYGSLLPLLTYNKIKSDRIIAGFSILVIRGLKYTKKYLPKGLNFYYRDPENIADMGTISFLFEIISTF